jgi:hypothetical protein
LFRVELPPVDLYFFLFAWSSRNFTSWDIKDFELSPSKIYFLSAI